MEIQLTHCNICGQETETVFELDFRDVVGMAENYTQRVNICRKCGLIYTKNPFSGELLANRYKNNSKYEFDSGDYILGESESYKRRSLRQYQMLERELPISDIHSVLEVGAASGYNLSLYSRDRRVTGIEPSKGNCKSAKELYGVDMFCGTFTEYLTERRSRTRELGGNYDLIFLSHILEHIVNPSCFIRELSEINTKYFFVEVPTLDYKLIDEPYGMFVEEHVNIFTLESLQNLMNENGYELIHGEMIGGFGEALPSGWPAISTVWKKSRCCKRLRMIQNTSDSLARYLAASEEEMRGVRKIIQDIPSDKKLAIWGTGHHASMLLANTELSQKNIVAVYDSDKKRAGYTMNGTVIRSFDPEDLKLGKVEAVLLATYTAQKAIEKIIEPYGKTTEVIKLYDIL